MAAALRRWFLRGGLHDEKDKANDLPGIAAFIHHPGEEFNCLWRKHLPSLGPIYSPAP
jgi:hypothetical protein